MLGHPFGPGQMAFIRTAGSMSISIRVDVQYNPSNLSPIGAISVSIEQPQIGYHMLLIIAR